MERKPIKSFFSFVLVFVLLSIWWDTKDILPLGFIPLGIIIAIFVIYGIRAWRGGDGSNTHSLKPKR